MQEAGKAHYTLGNYPKADLYYEQMLDTLKKADQNPTPEQYFLRADACYKMRVYWQAIGLCREGMYRLKSLDMQPTPTQYQRTAHIFYAHSDFRNAFKYYKMMMETLEEAQQEPTAKQCFQYAETFQKLDQFGDAIKYFLKGIEILEAAGKQEASYYESAGFAYYHNRDYKNAFKYYEKMMQALKEAHQEPTKTQCYWLAKTCEKLGEFDKAAECYVKSIEISEAAKDVVHYFYEPAGAAFYKAGKFGEAYKYYVKRAQRFAAEMHKPTEQQCSWGAEHYERVPIGEFDKAAMYYVKRIEVLRAAGKQPTEVHFEKAINAFDKGKKRYSDKDDLINALLCFEGMLKVLEMAGQAPTEDQYRWGIEVSIKMGLTDKADEFRGKVEKLKEINTLADNSLRENLRANSG